MIRVSRVASENGKTLADTRQSVCRRFGVCILTSNKLCVLHVSFLLAGADTNERKEDKAFTWYP